MRFLIIIRFKEAKEKSSHYGLDILGYTCATTIKTIGYAIVKSNKTIKIILVRIINCNSFI